VAKWRAFDAEYSLDSERTDTQLTIRYEKTSDSTARLHALVAGESSCCSFVDWNIVESDDALCLIVTGTEEELAALNVTKPQPRSL